MIIREARQRVIIALASLAAASFWCSALILINGAVRQYDGWAGGLPPSASWHISINGDMAWNAPEIHRDLLNLLDQADSTVTLVADYSPLGPPVLAVFDNSPKPQPLMTVEGRWFDAPELRSNASSLIVRQSSYLLSHPSLGGSSPVLPDGPIIGTFPKGRDTGFEFVCNFSGYSPAVLPADIYMRTDDIDLARRVFGLLLRNPQDVSVAEPVSLAQFLGHFRYTWPLAGAGVLSLAILAVAVADTALAVEPDQRVRRLVGARRLRLAGEEASRSGVVALMAGLIGLGLMALVDTVTGWHIISQVNWWVPIVAWVGPATVTVATAFLTCLTRQQPLGRQR